MINKASYVQYFLTQKGLVIGIDYTINDTGDLIAWNSTKGIQPTAAEIDSGVLLRVKTDFISTINTKAGEIRATYLADGQFIAEEYRLAEEDAKDYKARGYNNPIPQTVQDYATIAGAPVRFIADNIIQKSLEFRTLFAMVRNQRIKFGTLISIAKTVDEIETLTQSGLIELEKLRKK